LLRETLGKKGEGLPDRRGERKKTKEFATSCWGGDFVKQRGSQGARAQDASLSSERERGGRIKKEKRRKSYFLSKKEPDTSQKT